ncbi:MAG: sugar ABC transporter ATP-binding protein [Anaerolineae bacterium]|nr:sugar ABC transporter ATP-binding protein [Anaerolineae bacterium]
MSDLCPLLSLSHASKSYGGSPALIDATLDLLPGEVHALVGENGAGKSTLIKILAGVVAPDHAEIAVGGAPAVFHNAADAFAHGLRFIHQELNIVPGLSVAENIFLSQPYPRRAGALVDWARLNAAARAALAALHIDHIDPRSKIARLNTGDQMLVKIAGAFAGSLQNGGETGGSAKDGANLFVMDEPTAALTGAEADRLFAVIARLKARGCAVLYVTHRLDEVFAIADRVTVMRDGRVVAVKPIHQTDSADLIRLMTGREISGVYPPRASPLSSAPLLRIHDLRTAHLAGAAFDLRAGEILGVAGLTGSGRSELLRALVGADRLSGGEITLNGSAAPESAGAKGRDLHITAASRWNPTAAWRSGIAYVPEERRTQGLILSRMIRDNVTLPHLSALSGGGVALQRGREEAAAARLGDAVRLKARDSRQTTRQLSGGNQQKVLFARALAGEAWVLLLDEPTRGVDIGAKYDIYAVIRDLSARGVGVVLASSDLAELVGMCDRVLILRERRQSALLDTTGLTQDALLTACYGPGDPS